jgi:hypothetical protein
MGKCFNEFSKDEQNEILRLNSEILVDKLLNWDDLFNTFMILVETRREEVGLHGLRMSFDKKGDIVIFDSTCSTNVFHTIEKLMHCESMNPDIVNMLAKTKTLFDLINDLTINVKFAKIEIKDELFFIKYEYDFYPTEFLEELDIYHLYKEIKKYTQEPNILKEIKKLELQKLYGLEINHQSVDDIRSIVLDKIKIDLKVFEVYLQSKIENIKKQLQNELRLKFDNIYSPHKLKEILLHKTDIMFDEKNYNIITTFDNN